MGKYAKLKDVVEPKDIASTCRLKHTKISVNYSKPFSTKEMFFTLLREMNGMIFLQMYFLFIHV